MTSWHQHNVGIDYREIDGYFGSVKYQQRCTYSKKIEFTRWSFKKHVFGIFHRKLNYGKTFYVYRGWEMFTNHYALGIMYTKPIRNRVSWVGSIKEPYTSCVVRVGRVFLAFDAPKWMQRMKAKSVERKIRDAFEQPATYEWE